MGLRIRGHYRIDAEGRVIPIVPTRGSVLSYVPASPFLNSAGFRNRPVPELKLKFVEVSIVSFILFALLTATLTIIPKVRQAIAAAQAAQNAATRVAVIRTRTATQPVAVTPQK